MFEEVTEFYDDFGELIVRIVVSCGDLLAILDWRTAR